MITALIFIALGIGAFFVAAATVKGENPSKVAVNSYRGAGVVLGVVGLVALASSATYTQERGEAVVLKDIFGNIVGTTTETGLHFKAPWVDTIRFNILNQPVAFLSESNASVNDTTYVADGPHITVQDSEAVSHDVDVTVTYSIEPGKVEEIYSRYRDENSFKQALVFQDIRTVTRNEANKFNTQNLLTNKEAYANSIEEGLKNRWAGSGVTVARVNLQEIRSPQAVADAFASAQEAQINVSREQANLEAAEVTAQQQVARAKAEAESKQILATGEAEANKILEASLTDRVLQQRYLDTLRELANAGNLVVVPEGLGGMINILPGN